MAEEAPGIQSRKRLFTAVLLAFLLGFALGLVLVALYNASINVSIRGPHRSLIRLCKAARDLRRGDKVTRQDIIIEVVPKQYTEALGKVIQAKDIEFLTGHREGLNKPVRQGEWFRYADLTGSLEDDELEYMRFGMVALTVQISPAEFPGGILRPGRRVNIVGRLEVGNRPLQPYQILKAVRVLAVAGPGGQEDAEGAAAAGLQQVPRICRSVTIEVHGSVSPGLKEVLSRVKGDVWLEVCHPDARPEGDKPYSQVNPKVVSLTTQSAVPQE